MVDNTGSPFTYPRNRLIAALDVPALPQAQALAQELTDHIAIFKVGLELCTAEGVPRVVEAISATGSKIFLDLKFKDIPNTVAGALRAVAAAAGSNVHMLTLHCDGGSAMLQAAVAAVHEAYWDKPAPLLLGVTVLTSISDEALLHELGIGATMNNHVRHLALLAQEAGLNGVIASPQEVRSIKEACGPDFLVVTPGVRPTWATTGDQQRVMTPQQAWRTGADYLVIGRPITNPPAEIGGPAAAVDRLVEELKKEKKP